MRGGHRERPRGRIVSQARAGRTAEAILRSSSRIAELTAIEGCRRREGRRSSNGLERESARSPLAQGGGRRFRRQGRGRSRRGQERTVIALSPLPHRRDGMGAACRGSVCVWRDRAADSHGARLEVLDAIGARAARVIAEGWLLDSPRAELLGRRGRGVGGGTPRSRAGRARRCPGTTARPRARRFRVLHRLGREAEGARASSRGSRWGGRKIQSHWRAYLTRRWKRRVDRERFRGRRRTILGAAAWAEGAGLAK